MKVSGECWFSRPLTIIDGIFLFDVVGVGISMFDEPRPAGLSALQSLLLKVCRCVLPPSLLAALPNVPSPANENSSRHRLDFYMPFEFLRRLDKQLPLRPNIVCSCYILLLFVLKHPVFLL